MRRLLIIFCILMAGLKSEAQIGIFRGFQLGGSKTITRVSDDSTLADNSRVSIPTEWAVRNYLDNRIFKPLAGKNVNIERIGQDYTFSVGDFLNSVSVSSDSTKLLLTNTDGSVTEVAIVASANGSGGASWIEDVVAGENVNINKSDPRNPVISANAQIQADWNQGNTMAQDYIKNKPAIPSASSGIYKEGNDFKLGGFLTSPAVINMSYANPVSFETAGSAIDMYGQGFRFRSKQGSSEKNAITTSVFPNVADDNKTQSNTVFIPINTTGNLAMSANGSPANIYGNITIDKLPVIKLAGRPFSSQLPAGQTAVFEDTTTGKVYLWANINGTFFKTELLQN